MIPDKSGTVKPQKFSLENLCLNPSSLIMLLNGTFSCFKSISLAFRIFSCGILMAAPVIKDLRNMADFLRLHRLDTAENKIIILSSVKFAAQHSHFLDHVFVHHEKMADIIDRTEQIRVVVRLEMRLEKLVAVHGHFIFIGIKNTDVPVFV